MSNVFGSLTLSFPAGTEVLQEPGSNRVTVQVGRRRLTVQAASPGVGAALRMLAGEGATERRLGEMADDAGGELAEMYFLVQRFADAGLLTCTVLSEGQPLAVAVPLAEGFRFLRVEAGAGRRFVLSRFAFLRREGRTLVLESPLCRARVVLHGWKGVALVAELAQPRASRQFGGGLPGVTPDEAEAFLRLLAGVGMLPPVGEGDKPAEDEQAALAQWEFHDLLFHSRSRQGRHASPFGGTYRFRDTIAPLPAVKPPMSEDIVALDKPDLERLQEADVPFTAVVEGRKSLRQYGERPITAGQLGEFLYRSARLKQVIPADPQELASRPYPSGGAIYELELYVVANECADLSPGLYHYAAKAHQLSRLGGRDARVEALVNDARAATGGQCRPQVLIIVAARFQRLTWKYQSLAYALILKHVGALYQTMYLVATAMGLAPCALGGGNSDLFAQTAGLDYYSETSVGEFLLGSRGP
jgi:SagB-type dehydrogenase family enzyme